MLRKMLSVGIGTGCLLASMAQAIELKGSSSDKTKVDLYAKVSIGNYFCSERAKRELQAWGRVGLKGSHELEQGFGFIGHLEYQQSLASGSSELRLAYLGIEEEGLGKLVVGKEWAVTKLVGDMSSLAPEFGGDVLSFGRDKFGNGRTMNLIKYVCHLPAGITLGMQYIAPHQVTEKAVVTKTLKGVTVSDAAGGTKTTATKDLGVNVMQEKQTVQQGHGGAIALIYKAPIGVNVGMSYSQAANRFTEVKGKYARSFSAALSCTKHGVTAAGGYNQTGYVHKPFAGDLADDFASRTSGFEVGFAYEATLLKHQKLKPSMGFVRHFRTRSSAFPMRPSLLCRSDLIGNGTSGDNRKRRECR